MEEIASLHPLVPEILAAYGLHCVGCAYSTIETLEEGAAAHGLSDDDITMLLVDLEGVLDAPLPTSAPIIITAAAAAALQAIVRAEKKEHECLRIIASDTGGFCLEFCHAPTDHDIAIDCPDAPSLRIIVATQMLARIGGATIDQRDGRFKLDLPGSCACRK